MSENISIRGIDERTFAVTIEGRTPIMAHRFSEKAKKQIRDKQQNPGKAKRMREAKDPEAEFEAAKYIMEDGTEGFPVTAIKNAMFSAAHKDLGIPKTLVSASVFIEADGYTEDGVPCVRIESNGSKMREDVVRVGMGAVDLRYRPEYREWAMHLRIQFDGERMSPETIVNLLERAGFGYGLGEWRPEKNGEFGRFFVRRSKDV